MSNFKGGNRQLGIEKFPLWKYNDNQQPMNKPVSTAVISEKPKLAQHGTFWMAP